MQSSDQHIINISGIICSGKTSLLHRLHYTLKEKLENSYFLIKLEEDTQSFKAKMCLKNFYRNPTNYKYALALQQHYIDDIKLKREYLQKVFKQHKKVIVLSDLNFYMTPLAYIFSLKELDLIPIDYVLDFVNKNNLFNSPKNEKIKQIHLTCSVPITLERLKKRDTIENKTLDSNPWFVDYLSKLDNMYSNLIKERKDITVMNSEQLSVTRLCDLLISNNILDLC